MGKLSLKSRSSRRHLQESRRNSAIVSTVGGDPADDIWSMPDYSTIVETMKSRYDIRVRKWRRNMSGCAWRVYYHDGRTINWIESPVPRTPISLAIFLHEVGHHAIGFSTYKHRCEEEYHAWQWAICAMRQLGVEPDAKVKKRVELSMQYAVGKALRRGIKRLPHTLERYIPEAA